MPVLTPRDRIIFAVAIFGGQRNLARAMEVADRNVRRWVAGQVEPTAYAVGRAREVLVQRGEEIARTLAEWPSSDA